MTDRGSALAGAATHTLESMCFFFVSTDLTDEQTAADTDAAIEVHFRGPLSGRLVVRFAGGALPVLAANMLGDTEGTPTMQRDALGELANVICGNLLPMLDGSEAVYAIGSPQPALMLHSEPAAHATVSLGLDTDGRVDLLLFVDDAVAA